MHFFLASLLAVGSLPLNTINTYAADTPTSDVPAHQKTLTPNGDGTYTISLSVTGKASSSTTQNVTKSNVILAIDTSGSMNGNANGYDGSRLAAEKDALTKDDGIIDKLLANNTDETTDIIELYGINFGTRASTAWNWSTNGDSIKEAINDLGTSTGTNWEEALISAKQAADAKHAAEPDENTYVIFMTDGEPTTHQNDYTVNTNYGQEWGYANDNAREIVTAGYSFYGIFTFGSGNSSNYLKSLVNYAYTGSGTYNSGLSSNYVQYFYDATDTQALIDALEAIVNEITSSVGYTNIAINDGLTDLASSMKVDGKISNLTYTRSGGSYGSGTAWADAPEATTTDGTINWNLGSRVLEDGVTYTVSFVVWPSQESYDLIADLNNGKITYSDLSDSQKTSVIKNPDGSYTFKTNTDSPTLTYSTITTTTSDAGTETVVSTPTTIDIENPKPVGLRTEKLTLEKKWEDSLDPSQREEVEEVVLDFYKDGDKYEKDIHLNEDNSWKLPDHISIAPGIMISDSSANYDLLKSGHTEYSFNGKTYIILEEGHDYYFDEHDINNHFELTNYVYHPMLVDNELMNVFFNRNASDTITGIKEFKDMDSVSATNTLKGGINIEKKVVDKSGNTVDTDDSFEISAHLIDTNGNDYDYDYRVYYGEKNPEYESHKVLNSDGSVKYSRSEHVYGTGELTETLYLGDVIRIVNVDSGVQYYVEENEKAGYVSIPEITYKEAYGTDSPVNSTETKEGYYVVSGNTASNVTVTNKFLDEKTKVDFEKTWYDTDGNVLSSKTLPGSITIELFKKGADGKKVSTGQTKKVTADTEWKGSFTELPKYDNGVAIVYSVEERAIEGATYDEQKEVFFEYDSEENNGQHAVVGKWTVETLEDIIVKNTWKPATESVTGRTSFDIVKVNKATGEKLAGATFELKLKDGATTTVTTDSEGKATFNNLDAGEYTLKETNAPEGYRSISTEPNINITKIKKLNTVDLDRLQNFYEYVFSFSTSQVDGYEYDVNSRTFTVKNEPIPYDNIVAAKVWDDDNDRDGLRKNYANYYVAVKNNSGKYVAYEKLALEDKDDYEFTHLPTKTVDGEDITYEIVEASTCSGKDNAITCTEFKSDKNYTAVVNNGVITNFHEPELINEDDDDPDNDGKLTVQKLWDGEDNELVRPTTVTIELYANGVKVGEPVTLSAVTEWKHTFEKLYKNENGQPITYTVQESKLGETMFEENESVIIVYGEDNAIVGSWTKKVENYNVTNTWKEASDKIVYEGAKKFNIKKIDENQKPMAGVTFAIEGAKDRQTDTNGVASKTIPVSLTEKEESFEFVVSEKETLEGYELVKGSATISVSCKSKLSNTDAKSLTNTYTKTCEIEKDGSDKYVWDAEDLTLTVVNKRSMAKSLTIKKTVEGLSAEVLTDLEFTIEGPEDFGENGELTLKASKDCTFSDNVITCEVDDRIPTGNYIVKESNAEIEHFELTISGDNEVEKKVSKGDEVVFKITNTYNVEKVEYYVDKVWEDEHNKDGSRPDKLMINLLANGEAIDTIELTMKDAYIIDEGDEYYVTGDIWGSLWEGLPYADENAEVIIYTVEEVLESDDYEQLEVFGDDYSTVFVNYHEPVEQYHEPVDPCVEGGCGGDVVVPPSPNTGMMTGLLGEGLVSMGWIGNAFGSVAIIVLGVGLFVVGRREEEIITE